MNIYTPA